MTFILISKVASRRCRQMKISFSKLYSDNNVLAFTVLKPLQITKGTPNFNYLLDIRDQNISELNMGVHSSLNVSIR